ncbi:MAG: hypothetical protein COA33_009115 [Fluviicola sp.]|nr:hypothetical protein [Fluviicola sp.]
MKKAIKIILICFNILALLFSIVILGDELLIRIDNLSRGFFYLNDYTLLIPIGLFIFGVPSFIFNLKTFKYYRAYSQDEVNNIDVDLIDNVHNRQSIRKISVIWVSNFIFGIMIFSFGIFVLVIVLESFPLNELPKGLLRYLFVFGLLIMGLIIEFEGWRLKKSISLKSKHKHK